MKQCPDCKLEKAVSEFGMVKEKPSFYCKPCRRIRDHRYYHSAGGIVKIRERRLKNKETHKRRSKAWRNANPQYAKGKLLQQYWPELSWEEAFNSYITLLTRQNGVCAICECVETCKSKPGSTKLIRDLCVDHCHETGKIRGLLCDACNTLIAKAKDTPKICESAAIYLRKSA